MAITLICAQILNLCLLLAGLCIFCRAAETKNTPHFLDEKCVEEMTQRNPELLERFTHHFLLHACEESRRWLDQARAGAKVPVVLTPEQLVYFRLVTTCQSLQCVCDQSAECRQLATKLGRSGNYGGYGVFNFTLFLKEMDKKYGHKTYGDMQEKPQEEEERRSKRQLNDLKAETTMLEKYGRVTRKELRAMSDQERHRLFAALTKLKFDKIGNMTKYDIIIVYHTPEYAPEAHFGAGFLPFHREFLRNFEIALRLEDPRVFLPYWDSVLDSYLPYAPDSILWTEEFLGNGDGDVVTGFLANWTTVKDAQEEDLSPNRKLTRGVGQSSHGSVFHEKDVQKILNQKDFRHLVYCVNSNFELVHGANHMFVGGHMIDLRVAPNDPTFFFVHCWVDSIWETWRQSKQTLLQRESVFVADNETCNEYAHADSPLKPFSGKVKDGLSNKYTQEFFSYQARPSCTKEKPSCQGSPYLYCDVDKAVCMSKIRLQGNCTGFEGKDVCYKSKCINGICVLDSSTTSGNTGGSTPKGPTSASVAAATVTPKIPPSTKATPAPSPAVTTASAGPSTLAITAKVTKLPPVASTTPLVATLPATTKLATTAPVTSAVPTTIAAAATTTPLPETTKLPELTTPPKSSSSAPATNEIPTTTAGITTPPSEATKPPAPTTPPQPSSSLSASPINQSPTTPILLPPATQSPSPSAGTNIPASVPPATVPTEAPTAQTLSPENTTPLPVTAKVPHNGTTTEPATIGGTVSSSPGTPAPVTIESSVATTPEPLGSKATEPASYATTAESVGSSFSMGTETVSTPTVENSPTAAGSSTPPAMTEPPAYTGFSPSATPTTPLEIFPGTPSSENGSHPLEAKTVWFPITVLARQHGNASVAYPAAKIETHASNGQTYQGLHGNPDEQPYYTGSAFARMPSPFAGPNPSKATLTVTDEFGKQCSSLCLEKGKKYSPCQATITLDTDPAKTDRIPWTPTQSMAKLLNWRGYERSLDKFLFLCDVQSTAPNAPTTVNPVSTIPFVGSTGTYQISTGDNGYINIVTKNDADHQIANGGCRNMHRCCSLWANVGECQRNKWMQIACEWSCNVCNPGNNTASDACIDYYPQCAKWEAIGLCTSYPTWMEENCKQTCKVCSRSAQEMGLLCGEPKKSGCKNYSDNCNAWAQIGECEKNPWWMKENCPVACNTCSQHS